jgi:hypothetical protein
VTELIALFTASLKPNKVVAMLRTLNHWAARAVLIAAFAVLLFQLAGGLWLFAQHGWAAVHFPYPLDYGEGPLLDQSLRLVRGENIYQPALDEPPFVIANYPPLFPLVQAPFAASFGAAFWYGRAISLLSVVVSALFIGLTLHRLTRDIAAAIAGALLLPSFAFVLHWSAFNRVDSLALVLACAALYAVARNPQSRRGLAVVAALLTAAIFTRQSYALAAPLAAFTFLLSEAPRRRAFELAAMVAGASLLLGLLLQLLTGGGFLFHIVTANVNPFIWDQMRFRAKELLANVPVLLAVAGVFVLAGAIWRQRSWWLVAPFLLGAAASATTIGKTGSNVNYLYELCAALSLGAGALLALPNAEGTTLNAEGKAEGKAEGTTLNAERAAAEVPPYSSNATGNRTQTFSVQRSAFSVQRSAFSVQTWLRAALVLALAFQVSAMVAWSEEEYAPRVLGRIGQRAELDGMLELVRAAPGPVLADEFMGMLPLAGKRLELQPFELKQLADAGIWDERALTTRIDAREYALILIYDPPDWNSFDERWTGRQQLYILTGYTPGERIANTIVYRPN